MTTSSGREVARAVADAFGGIPQVYRYYDRDEAHHIDIVSCVDRPVPGFTTYSTLGLHESPNLLDNADVRVEFAGVASSKAPAFANVLATAAFFVMKDRWLAAPGVVFPSLLNDFELSTTLRHVMFFPPFSWPELGSVTISGELTVHWLLAVPISDAEREFLISRGFNTLESVFSEHEVAYFDLERQSMM